MALNEMIAQGAQFKMPDPLEQYGRIAQIQQAQNQNALAQYQISSAQRADETNTNFLGALRAAGNDPIKIQQAYINAGKGKEASEYATSLLTQQEKQGIIQKQQRDDVDRMKLDLGKNPSDENITAYMQDIDAHPTFSPNAKAIAKRGLTEMLGMSLDDRKKSLLTSGMTGTQINTAAMAEKTFTAAKPTEVRLGNVVKLIDMNPNSLTYGKEVIPQQNMGVTPDAASTAQTAATRLQFDRDKLKYEQENPDFKLVESSMPDGTTAYFSVNKAGVAKPISIQGSNLTGVNLPAQTAANRLTFDKEKLKYEQDNPGFTVQDTSNGLVAVNSKNPGDIRPLKIGDKGLISATAIASTSRLNFDKDKFAWEKANPGYTVRDTADGLVAVNNKNPSDVQPLMLGDKGIVSATTDTATKNRISQELRAAAQLLSTARTAGNRLAFDQTKFAWEKANPGFTVRETDTGLVAVNSKNPTDVRPISVDGTQLKGKPSAFAEKAAAQKVQMGKDLTQAITELTDVTKDGGLIDQSTGSGVGRAIDLGARIIGQATPGDIAIGKLQPIADIALKMVPRFEGPQSDKDTTSYKQAAGQLADPTLPPEIRKEAGKTVLRLMKARKAQFGTVDMVAEGAGTSTAAPDPLGIRN
jgi:hypothetical protein